MAFHQTLCKKPIYYEELIEGEDLQSYITQHNESNKLPLWDDTHKLIISYGISCAMEFIHKMKYTHGNIGPSNILLDSEFHPYLTGFSFMNTMNSKRDSNTEFNASDHLFLSPELIEYPSVCFNKPFIDVFFLRNDNLLHNM